MDSFPTGTKLRNNLEQVVHTYEALLPSSIYSVLVEGRWGSSAGKLLTAALAENNDSLPVGWLTVYRDHLRA